MNIKLFTFCIALLLGSTSFARIWRVNNNGGGGGDFTNAQTANNSGSVIAGDTIHLEPSPNSYGSLSASKRLVWLSTGAFLVAHPGEQFAQTPGRIDALNVPTSGANSVFSVYIDGAAVVSAPNVRLDRCYINGSLSLADNYGTNSGNDVIINCYVTGVFYFLKGTNHFVSNNIFESYIQGDPASSGILQNNVFNAVSVSPTSVFNSTFQNNIFNKTVGAYTFTNCIVQYNMSGSGGVLPAGSFNQNNVAMTNVFVNSSGNTDAAFVLKAGSPAIASGAAGADMGAFGGTTPFKLALQPAIPAVYKITAPFVPAGNTMNVTFSTRSNN